MTSIHLTDGLVVGCYRVLWVLLCCGLEFHKRAWTCMQHSVPFRLSLLFAFRSDSAPEKETGGKMLLAVFLVWRKLEILQAL